MDVTTVWINWNENCAGFENLGNTSFAENFNFVKKINFEGFGIYKNFFISQIFPECPLTIFRHLSVTLICT